MIELSSLPETRIDLSLSVIRLIERNGLNDYILSFFIKPEINQKINGKVRKARHQETCGGFPRARADRAPGFILNTTYPTIPGNTHPLISIYDPATYTIS
jgi:hypothetical protein